MFFWFKKKEIILDCFTYSPLAYKYAKPDFSYKFFPEWFIKLPKTKNVVNAQGEEIKLDTMKSCLAFKNYYTENTIMLPAPYHINVDVSSSEEQKYTWEIKFPAERVEEHSKIQYEGFMLDNYQHLKFSNPWSFKTNTFVNFLWTDPVWNRNNFLDYSMLPGILNFKYQSAAHFNLAFKYTNKPYSIDITLGEPFVMLAPLSDYKVKIKHHQIDKSEFVLLSFLSKQNGAKRYATSKKIIDAADKRDAMKRCPFHLR